MKIEVHWFQFDSDLLSSESVYKLAEIFARDIKVEPIGNRISDESYNILYREFGCLRSPKNAPESMEGHVGIQIGFRWDIILVPYEFAMKVLAFGALPKQINVID